MKPMRYAHSDGHTDVCYDDTGRYILTCGSDGDVRIWDGIDDDDAVSHRLGDRAYSIAFKNNRFLTATDTNSVQASKFPDGLPDGLVTRFTAPINHMVLNTSGTHMVAGSSDFTVKVVEVESSSHKVYRGHKAPVLSVALDPTEQLVATSSCDGSVQVWTMADQTEVKTLQVLDKCSDVSLAKSLCRLCWSPDGQFLFVPVDKEIHLYSRESWEVVDKLSHADVTGVVSVVSLSFDGQYLAAACGDGLIAVFDWQKRKLVEKRRHEKGLTITAIAWNPTNKHHLAFCDREGQLGLVEDLLTSPQETAESSTEPSGMQGVFDDDDDMLIQASCKAEENADGDDDDDAESIDLGAIKKSLMPVILGDEESRDSIWGAKPGEEAPAATTSTPVAPIVVEGFKPTPLQKAFQPGSTPVHLSSRFMKWNSVGIIRQYNTEDENSIDIEFHDTATHHAMHITNTSDYTMADLSPEAVVLATASDEESKSKLLCMHFGSWDSAKEWSTTMPDGEVIRAVAAGEGWVAAVTSCRNVRLFTVGGVQLSTFTLPGPVVCLTGHRQRLMAIYHAGMGIPGDQNMACTTLTIKGQKRSAEGTLLPLSPQSTLSWAGFSAEGTPFTMDSEGIVRMMNVGLAATWTQVADTREQLKGKSDHYWIVGVNENPQQLRCIPCKGSRYPATLPRPAVTVLPFRLALCEADTEKSQYEEQYLRSKLFAQHLKRLSEEGVVMDDSSLTELLRPAQEALMKLFALSARSDREFRAMEVCDMMPDEQTLQLSIKYATRQRHLQLAQRISQLAQQRAQEEPQEEEEEEDFREYLQARHNNSETEWSTKSSLGSRREEEEEGEEVDMDEEEEDRKPSGPMLNVKPKEKLSKKPSFGRANPFKISTQEKEAQGMKGSQVFDGMKKTVKERTPVITPLPVSIKHSKGGQRKIVVKGKQAQQGRIAFSNAGSGSETSPASKTPTPVTTNVEQSENKPSKKAPSAFELWLQENQEDLQEEHPDLSQDELSRLAAEQFRALPREERQVWLQKAKSQTPQPDGGETDKKRKRAEEKDDETPSKVQKSKPTSPSKKPLSQSTNSKLAGFAFLSKP
ncbi:WD repeat and HMG-box DNA-binding protein 1-like [Babylonia areolata]|uniref:WD repeat and HMG-box DNA-binding protein 1-like n=1 Tax=Babylonia areolata TaxID=304850 RepID=UPI003FD089B5